MSKYVDYVDTYAQASRCDCDEYHFQRLIDAEVEHRQTNKLYVPERDEKDESLEMYENLIVTMKRQNDSNKKEFNEVSRQIIMIEVASLKDLEKKKALTVSQKILESTVFETTRRISFMEEALGYITDMHPYLVTSAQLIKCKQYTFLSKDSKFNFFYMEKIYTVNGKHYITSDTFKVLADPASHVTYDHSGPEHPLYYDNLMHAKNAFLSSIDTLEQEHAKGKLGNYSKVPSKMNWTHELSGAVDVKFLGSKLVDREINQYAVSSSDQDDQDETHYKLIKEFGKMVTVNDISYVVAEEYTIDSRDRSESGVKSHFMSLELNASDRYDLMHGNYREFGTFYRISHIAERKEREYEDLLTRVLENETLAKTVASRVHKKQKQAKK